MLIRYSYNNCPDGLILSIFKPNLFNLKFNKEHKDSAGPIPCVNILSQEIKYSTALLKSDSLIFSALSSINEMDFLA